MVLSARQRTLGTLEHLRRLAALATLLQTLVAEGVPAQGQQARLVLARSRVRAVAGRTAQHSSRERDTVSAVCVVVFLRVT